MSASLYLLIIIIMMIMIISAVIAKSSHEKDTFSDMPQLQFSCTGWQSLYLLRCKKTVKINKILKKK